MAYRKVNDNRLAFVADAIRSKGGTSDALVFPDGFVSAISAIQTGGGSGVALDATEKSLLLTMFKNAAYTADMSATIAQLETLWSGTEEPADVSQTGSVLSIVSGVTATQNGAVLAIA